MKFFVSLHQKKKTKHKKQVITIKNNKIMKRFILSMAMMLTVALSASAMSYEQARERALFLTARWRMN